MKFSKSSHLLILAWAAVALGCQSTQGFRLTSLGYDEIHVVETATNRVVHECYFVNAAAENNWRYQYFLYLLDEKNRVIPVLYPTNQGDVECKAHLKKVEKILARATHVKLCLHDRLRASNDPRDHNQSVNFGELGIHTWSYEGLTFDRICDAKECYALQDVFSSTCPTFKF